MRKFLPLILLGVGVLVVLGAWMIISKSKSQSGGTGEDANVPEIPQSEWPVVSLTPTSNPAVKGSEGHWLDFKVERINIPGAATMDYELIYSTSNGGQQGVPGTVKLTGADIERKLLLGSESSGKFRYDEGVTGGTMTLRFRDASGKLIGKLSTKFTYSSPSKGVFQVTMNTFADGTKTFTTKF